MFFLVFFFFDLFFFLIFTYFWLENSENLQSAEGLALVNPWALKSTVLAVVVLFSQVTVWLFVFQVPNSSK